ncbi:MAG: hypothetical protein WBB29_02660 [Geitlerinemataceae cyanobacterium]
MEPPANPPTRLIQTPAPEKPPDDRSVPHSPRKIWQFHFHETEHRQLTDSLGDDRIPWGKVEC